MTEWKKTPFTELLVDSKDGEWGEGDAAVGLREAIIIRGTDFGDINNPGADFPKRWIKEQIVARKRLQPGDLILETAGGTSTQSTGRSVFLTKSFFDQHPDIPVLCASFSRHLRLDGGKYSSRFIGYFLQLLYRCGYMGVFNIQHTGVSRFQYTSFKNHTELQVPDLPTQRKIAAILSAYDELIENNKRRIALLEKMAEEIYREWFVRLRFPGHEKVKVGKGVPQGWERLKVVMLTSYLKRGVAPKYDDSAAGVAINQKCIRDSRIDLKFARHQSREVSTARKIRFGDVLVNSTGEGTLGRVAQVLVPIENCIVDSHVTIVRPKDEVPVHYFGMTLKAWEQHFVIMGRGATNQTELAPSVIGGVEVVMPTKQLAEAFELQAAPMFAQVTQLAAQNEILVKTRDRLLPRLISGKLSVDDLDIQFPSGMTEEMKKDEPSCAQKKTTNSGYLKGGRVERCSAKAILKCPKKSDS